MNKMNQPSVTRVLFMGTGDIALPSFRALLEDGPETIDVIGLFTQPDRPVGRKQVLTPPAIKTLAERNTIPVWQPEKLRGSEELKELLELKPDLIIVMAYGQILPKSVIECPAIACINLHASLLPKYRGASCIQGAIDAGDSSTGITVMHVAPALDEGDIILQHELTLEPHHTGGVVHDLLAEVAPNALLEALEALINGSASRIAQDDEKSNYVPKLMREDGELDWSQSAEILDRRIRAYDPWPGTTTTFSDKEKTKRLKIFPPVELVKCSDSKPGEVLEINKTGLTIACGTNAIRIKNLQPEGSPRLTIEQFSNSGKLHQGDILG